jgi:hypothetical protein
MADGVLARPASVGDWEDLLVRLDIGPRAVRLAVEELPPPEEGGRDARWRRAEEVLRELVLGEVRARSWLDAMREGRPLPEVPRTPSLGLESGDVEGLLHRFTEHRARNFAAAQRRGLEVWEWEGDAPAGGRVSAYQLLSGRAAEDGRAIGALRRLGREPAG